MKSVSLCLGVAVLAGWSGVSWGQSPASGAAATTVDPPTPAAASTVLVLQKVCLPVLEGQDLSTIARGAGLKKKGDNWILPISGKRHIQLSPPTPGNPHVCGATIVHRVGGQPAIWRAVSDWALAQTPPLQPGQVNQSVTGPDYLRTTSTWYGTSGKSAEVIALSEEKRLDGEPVGGDTGQTELLISLKPS